MSIKEHLNLWKLWIAKTITIYKKGTNAYILTAHPPAGHFEVIFTVALRMK